MNSRNLIYQGGLGAGFLRLPQVLSIIPVSRSTWWKWVSEGLAPKPLKLGSNITVWRAEDIAAFLAQAGEG